MVLSLEDFDGIAFPQTPPIYSPDPQSDTVPPTKAADEPLSQQNPSLATPALDPALFTLSPPAPNRATNPTLHSEDLTQLACHLVFQKGLSKPSANELLQFAQVFLSADTPVSFSPGEHSVLLENNLSGLRPHNSR